MTTDQPVRSPQTAPLTVRKATLADAPVLTTVLAKAFDKDPLVDWWARKGRKRGASIEKLFARSLRTDTLPFGEVYADTDLRGTALWEPPGKPPPSLRERMAFRRHMAGVAGLRHARAVIKSLDFLDERHPHVPHFYLLAIGVLPEMQGRGLRGLATALMQPVLERCDRERIPAYLVCTNVRNVPLYERNGFAVTEEVALPKGGPKQWLMWRDPQGG